MVLRTKRVVEGFKGEGRLLYEGEFVAEVSYKLEILQPYLDGVPTPTMHAKVAITGLDSGTEIEVWARTNPNGFELELEDGRRQRVHPRRPGEWVASGGPEQG